MTERVKRLLDSMRLGEHEGVVVYDPSNMFYLSGYTGEGLVLVARGISAIITDFRYTEQAQAQAPGFEVLMTEKGKSHEDIARRPVAPPAVLTPSTMRMTSSPFTPSTPCGRVCAAWSGRSWAARLPACVKSRTRTSSPSSVRPAASRRSLRAHPAPYQGGRHRKGTCPQAGF